MYDHCFSKLSDVLRKKLRQIDAHLISFTEHLVWTFGILSFPLTLDDHHIQGKNTEMLDFMIIQLSSAYNRILGRSAMNKFEAIASTIHGLVRF